MNEMQVRKRVTGARGRFRYLRMKINFISKELVCGFCVIKLRLLTIARQMLTILEKPFVNFGNYMRWWIRREDSYDAERR